MRFPDPAAVAPPGERRPWMAALALAILLSLIAASQTWIGRTISNEPITVWQAAVSGLGYWVLWAVLVPAVLTLGRRFTFRRGRVGLSVVVHLTAAAAMGTAHALAFSVSQFLMFADQTEPFPLSLMLRAVLLGSRIQFSILTYFIILGLGRAAEALVSLRERERQAAQLQAQLTSARLEALTLRLQPHFLFNTLHAIGVLIREAPATAERMVSRLGDLLRATLTNRSEELTLGEELELLRLYLEIEQTRFADRLTVEWAVDPTVVGARVPAFLLQPLAENAITHGIARRAEGGRLRIQASRRAEELVITVWNDGALASGGEERVGLGTTRERLATRYQGRASVVLAPSDSGVATTLRLPWDAVDG